jgi:hypothetical protein
MPKKTAVKLGKPIKKKTNASSEVVTKENAQKIYQRYQMKRKKAFFKFAKKPIAKKRVVKNPSIRVFKKYNRFSKEAKEKGWLKNPVETEDDKFEVFDVTTGGVMRELSPMVLGPVIDKYGDVVGLNIEDAWQGSKVFPFHMNGGTFNPKSQTLWKDGNKNLDPNGTDWVAEWKKWSRHIQLSGEAKRHRVPKSFMNLRQGTGNQKEEVIDTEEGNQKEEVSDEEEQTAHTRNPNVPLFSYYREKRLPYVKARKLMYIPWYAELAKQTEAYKYLKERYDAGISLILLDSDGDGRDKPIEKLTEENLRKRVNDPSKIFGHGFVLASLILGVDVWSDEKMDSNE